MSGVQVDTEAPVTEQESRIPGEPGAWIVIIGDLMVFAILFGTYFYYQADAPELFAESQETLSLGLGLTNTLILLASSIAVVAGVHAGRDSRPEIALRAFAAAMTLGLAFVAVKGMEWGTKLSDDLGPGTNDFYMLYYVLTGLHLVHVLVGLVVLAVLRHAVTRPRAGGPSRVLLESGAMFWHLVDMIWLVIFPVVYLAHAS